MSRRTAAVTAALAAAGLAAGLVADSGHAQDPGRTLTLTYVGQGDVTMTDIAPKGLRRGKASLGDEFFVSTAIRRTDGVRGRFQFRYAVSQKRVSLVGSRGQLSGVYRFADGAIFVEGEGTYEDSDVDRGAIVGGTGAYAGARGTLDSDKTHDVLHLLP